MKNKLVTLFTIFAVCVLSAACSKNEVTVSEETQNESVTLAGTEENAVCEFIVHSGDQTETLDLTDKVQMGDKIMISDAGIAAIAGGKDSVRETGSDGKLMLRIKLPDDEFLFTEADMTVRTNSDRCRVPEASVTEDAVYFPVDILLSVADHIQVSNDEGKVTYEITLR